MDDILHQLRNPGMNDSPVNSNKQSLPIVSKWCRISSIHSMFYFHGHLTGTCDKLQASVNPKRRWAMPLDSKHWLSYPSEQPMVSHGAVTEGSFMEFPRG